MSYVTLNWQAPPTSLDPLDLSPHPPRNGWIADLPSTPTADVNSVFIHSGWAPLRRRTISAMIEAGLPTNRLLNFAGCGGFATVEVSNEDPPAHRIRAGWCNDRWCQVCAARRATKQRLILAELLELGPALFITLTLRSHPVPSVLAVGGADALPAAPVLAADLAAKLQRLHACFARLRATDLWKNRVTAGRAYFEIKWNADAASWHAHLHVLAIGRYMPQADLAKAWLKITGDSFIVDIRRPHTAQEAAAYVTKYVTKAIDRSVSASHATLTAAVLALHRCRTVVAFGKPVHCPKRDPEHLPTWTRIGSLKQVLDDALSGSTTALALLQHFRWLHLPPQLTTNSRPSSRKDPPCGLSDSLPASSH